MFGSGQKIGFSSGLGAAECSSGLGAVKCRLGVGAAKCRSGLRATDGVTHTRAAAD